MRLYYTQTLHIFGEGRLKFPMLPLLERLITHISGDYEIDKYNLSAIIFFFPVSNEQTFCNLVQDFCFCFFIVVSVL